MPESDDHNSSLNRREPASSEFKSEHARRSELEDSGTETPIESEWDRNELDDEFEDFDLSFKFEDYAPLWLQKVKSFFGRDPEWSIASTVGAVAIILTVLLLLAMPEDNVKRVADSIVAPEPALVTSLPQPELIDSRIEIEPSAALPVVELGTAPLYVSFGDLQDSFSGIAARDERPVRPERPPRLPEFNLTPEPASAPSLVMNVQNIRIIEREMRDPTIDDLFVVESRSSLPEIQSQLEPGEHFLFDQSWKLIDLARADADAQQTIRPTLYHERFPGGEHLQVGQEQPVDRSQLDRLTRTTAPPPEEHVNIEIKKQIPRTGTAQNLLTYSILVKNRGTSPAYDIHVDETLSPHASLVEIFPPAEVKQNHLHWKIARLDPDEERELQVKVFLNREGSVKTTSNIKLASNVAASTDISAVQLDLQIKGPEVLTEGETFPLDIVVSNQGEQNQQEVSLNLDLPEGLTHQQGRQLTFKLDQLAAGQSRTLRARIKATKSGRFTSQAVLMAAGNSLGEAVLAQNIVEKKVKDAPTPPQQTAPASTPKQSAPTAVPAATAKPAPAAAPVQACPCQPVYYGPVFYLVP